MLTTNTIGWIGWCSFRTESVWWACIVACYVATISHSWHITHVVLTPSCYGISHYVRATLQRYVRVTWKLICVLFTHTCIINGAILKWTMMKVALWCIKCMSLWKWYGKDSILFQFSGHQYKEYITLTHHQGLDEFSFQGSHILESTWGTHSSHYVWQGAWIQNFWG